MYHMFMKCYEDVIVYSIPVFNEEIKEAIEKLHGESYSQFETMFVANGDEVFSKDFIKGCLDELVEDSNDLLDLYTKWWQEDRIDSFKKNLEIVKKLIHK